MSNNQNQLVHNLWNYCNIQCDDSLFYGDYLEQLTFLVFLKMADKQSKPPFNNPSRFPKGKDWPAMLAIALSPLAERMRIVAEGEQRLSVVDELEATVSTNLQRATRLRQSILQKAFTG